MLKLVVLCENCVVRNIVFPARRPRKRPLAVVLGAVLAVSALAAGCSSASNPKAASSAAGGSQKPAGSSLNLSRVATDNSNFIDDLTAIGVPLACIGSPSGTPVADETTATVASMVAKAKVFAIDPLDPEQLAACHPTLIVTDNYEDPANNRTDGKAFDATAPTVYSTTTNGCFVFNSPYGPEDSNPTGKCFTDWKNWLHLMAVAMGPVYVQRAADVIAAADRRAAAIRGQVQGKVIASMNIFPSDDTFNVYNAVFPFSNGIVRDLGVKVPVLPAGDYPKGCTPTTGECATNPLSAENFPALAGADMLLIATYTASAASIRQEESNPLFKALPAVKAGRVSATPDTAEGGALAAGDDETLIEQGFGIKEYTASLTGGSGSTIPVTLTFEQDTRKLCWAVTPPAGTRPGGALSLGVPGGSNLTLGTPSYAPAEAADSGWNTSPVTYLASGCDTLSAADAASWQSAGNQATLSLAGQTGPVASGITSIVYGSKP
jgi:ABC-type Fe3+-hydroxamate transport system substrate-binding protein